ncbi:MAG: nuclear transport factor 2 family protein [Acidimicrobiales bacterium]
MPFSREEIQAAFDRYRAAANEAGRSGDWQPWVKCFTPDVHYIEHLYGDFHGREDVLAWITKTMGDWPFTHMQLFPWDWYTIDADQGWVIGQLRNDFIDPGDGVTYGAANWTRLVYAGDGQFASEEDIYNPAEFAPAVDQWLAAWSLHHPDEATGATPGD